MSTPLKMTTPGDREILIERRFDASRARVWRAMTEPDLIRRWMLGPPGWTMPICEVDLRVGGKMRFQWAREDQTMGLVDTLTEIVPEEKLVATEVFDEDWTGGETTVTQTLHDDGDGTILRTHIRYATQEARDGATFSGMTEGMESGYARLDGILAEAA